MARRTGNSPVPVVFLLLVTCLSGFLATPSQAMPPQLKAFANIVGHSYSNGYHHASGTLRLNNTSGSTMSLECTVTVTWGRKNGDIAKRSDHVTVSVGANTVRKMHFHVRFHDPDGLFLNIPRNAVPHCRLA